MGYMYGLPIAAVVRVFVIVCALSRWIMGTQASWYHSLSPFAKQPVHS
jgi:hypothetical protein